MSDSVEQQQQQNQDQGGSRGAALGSGQGAGSNADAKFTQEQVNAFIANERREVESRFDGYDDFKSKAEQFDQLTAEQKTELQKANDSAADFKSKWEAEQAAREKAETQLNRQKISATKGLDPELWDRVRGKTDDEIEADVQKLVEKFGTSGSGGGGRYTGPLQSGASKPDGQTAKERAASALRSLGNGR